MYKTIRQGENSLQYTILPQQDEGRAGPAVVHRRNGGSRKKSILAYIGLFFICTIITFAILIPLMVTSDLMPTPSWFYRHNNQQKVRDFRNPVNVKMSIQENHIIKGTPLRTTLTSTTTTSPTTTTTTQMVPTEKPAVHSSPLWTDALSVTEFQNLYKSDESMEQINGALNEDMGQEVIPTSTMRPQTTVNLFLSRARLRMTTTNSPIRPSLPSRNYPKHFSLQKHEKTPAPELTMAAVIPQETKAIQVDTNTEDMAQVHQNWLQSHWSYVDPYLQWRNYAADDRVLLPLILGVTLTMVVVIILMCYLVKRKRMCKSCRKSATGNNRNAFESVEAQDGEDHENLLTNEMLSEEE